jgi:hypothetical protein
MTLVPTTNLLLGSLVAADRDAFLTVTQGEVVVGVIIATELTTFGFVVLAVFSDNHLGLRQRR